MPLYRLLWRVQFAKITPGCLAIWDELLELL
jgi:hypothetical protein